ncbi:uncharacterized protein J3D65DRAFT_333075 [Phyllosticta citribraziliensis]|uniref:Uncharacterized protein n=1 Tax=Phyllosticta citribraziliensis TaxID=989973 RepID=A0ABR1LTP9_9PEZI
MLGFRRSKFSISSRRICAAQKAARKLKHVSPTLVSQLEKRQKPNLVSKDSSSDVAGSRTSSTLTIWRSRLAVISYACLLGSAAWCLRRAYGTEVTPASSPEHSHRPPAHREQSTGKRDVRGIAHSVRERWKKFQLLRQMYRLSKKIRESLK